MSNEAHGVYFSLVSLPRAAGVLQNGLKVLLKENITGINTSYLTDSYIVFTLKTESESKITIFGLKMMVKSGLKNVFEIPPCRRLLSLTSKKCPKSQIQ